jgi:uncharacterized protein
MKALIRQHPLPAFFVMAFAFAWLAVTPLIVDITLSVEPFQILGALAGPTLAAVIVTAVLDGGPGLSTFFKRYLQWRAGLLWWLFTLFGALVALTLVAAGLLGATVVTEFFSHFGLILLTYLIALVAGVILGPLWEEPGWRGFALPRLQAQFGPLLGTLILGVLWALWHLPGYLGGWMTAGIAALLVSSVAFSVIMTWVYNHTRGSLLLMILLHSSSNAALSVGSRVLPTDLPAGLYAFVYGGWIPALTYSLIAVVIIAATRGSLAYTQRPVEPRGLGLQPTPPG